MLRRVGCGVQLVGQLLVTAGDNPARLSSEAAWAMLCDSAPLPASSGQTRRHRLNRGGDRAANIGPATKRMLPPDRDDALVAEFHKNDPRAIRRALRLSFHYLDRHGSVAAMPIGCQGLGRVRRQDDAGLFDDERRGLEGCPRVTLVSIPDTGHFTLNTHPGEVAELILEAVCAAAQTPTKNRRPAPPPQSEDDESSTCLRNASEAESGLSVPPASPAPAA